MAAVITVADGDDARVELDEERMEGSEPRGVGQGRSADDGAQDRFEAGAVRGGDAGVDMCFVGRGCRLYI